MEKRKNHRSENGFGPTQTRLYFCDPDKNHECQKGACQNYCVFTSNKKARASIWKHLKIYQKGFPSPPC